MEVHARHTVLAEGNWGHLTGAAIKHFNLAEGANPPVWKLGAKEVWKTTKQWDSVVHFFGWPGRGNVKWHETGVGGWVYPYGENQVSIGIVVPLGTPDATVSAHDMLQTVKQHPKIKAILEGGERTAWGAKAIQGGGYWSQPKLSMPGAVLVGESGGMIDMASSRASTWRSSPASSPPRRSTSRSSSARRTSPPTRRPSPRATSSASASTKSATTCSSSAAPPCRSTWRRPAWTSSPRAGSRWPQADPPRRRSGPDPARRGQARGRPLPKPDGKYTFDKLSSVFITGNATRDDAPSHIRIEKNVPREVAETWKWMCPAGVYEIPEDAPETGNVEVIVNYTNCVQCGAITARGGRLTPRGRRRSRLQVV